MGGKLGVELAGLHAHFNINGAQRLGAELEIEVPVAFLKFGQHALTHRLAQPIGAVLAWRAWNDLGVALTPNPVPREGASLRMQGIYRHLRHPMYAAVLCAALGWAGVRGGWWHWGFVVALSVFFVAKIRYEETWLCLRYPGYAEYRAQTGMLWPRLRNRDR